MTYCMNSPTLTLSLGQVPTMAIEKVYMYNNTSIIQDEVGVVTERGGCGLWHSLCQYRFLLTDLVSFL